MHSVVILIFIITMKANFSWYEAVKIKVGCLGNLRTKSSVLLDKIIDLYLPFFLYLFGCCIAYYSIYNASLANSVDPDKTAHLGASMSSLIWVCIPKLGLCVSI